MKKNISILIICIIIASMLVGCQEQAADKDQTDIGDGGNNNGGAQTGGENDPDPILTVGTEVGNLFADVTLETLDGGTVSTADYRGRIIILNIWATRCPPCKSELPDFDRIASEYAEDVVVIAAHEDYTRTEAPSYVETNFPDSKIIFAYDTPYGDAYYAAGGDGYIPQTVIIDSNGIIIYADSGMLSHDTLVSIIEAAK